MGGSFLAVRSRTVNDELNRHNQELQLVNTDLVNLLETVDIPMHHSRREPADPPLHATGGRVPRTRLRRPLGSQSGPSRFICMPRT